MSRAALVVGLGVALLTPLASKSITLAAVVALGGLSFGMVWAPANSLLSAALRERGLDEAVAFALWMCAWAAGQAVGAVASTEIVHSAGASAPYLVLAGCFALTLAGTARLLDPSTTPVRR